MTDRERVELFLRRVDELGELTLAREGISYGTTFTWSEGEDGRFEFRGPNEEQFMALLVSLRHFVAEKEPTFYPRIHNIVFTALRDEELRGHMVTNRRKWDTSMDTSGIGYYINDLRVTPELAWDKLINGQYFHSDEEKRGFLDGLPPVVQEQIKQKLYEYTMAVMRVVQYTRNIIRKARQDGALVLG